MTQREERRKGTRERKKERENRDSELVSGTIHVRLWKRRAIFVKVLK